jgi:hypothetical protein
MLAVVPLVEEGLPALTPYGAEKHIPRVRANIETDFFTFIINCS